MTKKEKLQDIQDHPSNHQHPFDGLLTCCWIEGALDLELMEAHSHQNNGLGTNGSRYCDVIRGPCACGAWH